MKRGCYYISSEATLSLKNPKFLLRIIFLAFKYFRQAGSQVQSPLYWCSHCNLPLLQEHCDKCNSRADSKIKMRPPANPRPVLPHDEEVFKSAGLPWPIDYSMILNFYIGIDYLRRKEIVGWELIYSGKHIGDIRYDFKEQKLSFSPTSSYHPEIFSENKTPTTMNDVIEANFSHLNYIEQEASNFIKDQYKFIEGETKESPSLFMGFSGGKDSVVLTHIASLTGFKLNVFHIDTGIEPFGNGEFTAEFLSKYPNVHMIKVDSGDMFWRAMEKLGPPSIDFLWCRDLLKGYAMVREMPNELKTVNTEIEIDGARQREDLQRVNSFARVLKQRTEQRTVTKIRPIFYLTDMDIWMYTHAKNLPTNPSYTDMKTERLICLYCPGQIGHQFKKIKRAHPQAWDKFEKCLVEWRNIFKFPEEWVSKNLWIFNQPLPKHSRELGIKSRLEMVNARLNSCVSMSGILHKKGVYIIRGVINKPINLSEMKNQIRILGDVVLFKKGRFLKIKSENVVATISAETNEIVLVSRAERKIANFSRILKHLIVAHINCIGCGACTLLCPEINIRNNQITIGFDCTGCGKCVKQLLQICPVSGVNMGKYIPQIFKEVLNIRPTEDIKPEDTVH